MGQGVGGVVGGHPLAASGALWVWVFVLCACVWWAVQWLAGPRFTPPAPCPPSLSPRAADGEEEGGSGGGGGDPRAALVLQLLLSALEQPAPNLAHLLCGFDFDSGGWQPWRLWWGEERKKRNKARTRPGLREPAGGRPLPPLSAARQPPPPAPTPTAPPHAPLCDSPSCLPPHTPAGMGQVFLPDPRAQYNVLRVVLSAVQVRFTAGTGQHRLAAPRASFQVPRRPLSPQPPRLLLALAC